tara:strand:+ start:1143 stop:1577 length:435 start_codon:yes stop_codon:yes gene_type:complete
MLIKEVKASNIRRTRHRNLRQGKPYSTTSYKRDDESTTFHLACLLNNEPISCATFYPENNNFFSKEKAYRLRGMATDLEYRKKGIGKKIMLQAFEKIKKKKGTLLWCNARLVAVDFYKKLGLQIKGEEFDIPDIGPHYLMYKKI